MYEIDILKPYTYRCSPPEKSNEYQKIYSNWCHEFEKYKTAMKTWERKQEVNLWKYPILSKNLNIIYHGLN